MKSKMAFLMSVSVIFVVSSLSAQDLNINRNLDDLMLFKIREKAFNSEDEPKDYTGSPYSNEEFITGEIQRNNNVFVEVPIRFNMFNDWVEFKKDNRIYILDPDEQIKRVDFGDYKLVVKNYDYKENTIWGYLAQLDSGKASVFAKKRVGFREAQLAQALQSEGTPAKFQPLPDYYYNQIGDSEVNRIENMKSMISEFPDNQDGLRAFVKKEKISHRRAGDLIKFTQYYNSL